MEYQKLDFSKPVLPALIPYQAWRSVLNSIHHNKKLPMRNWPTGVACRNCGGELIAPTPSHIKSCFPPLMEVYCNRCKDSSYIISHVALNIEFKERETE